MVMASSQVINSSIFMRNRIKDLLTWTVRLTLTSKTSSAKCKFVFIRRVDLLRPKNHIQFTLDDFLAKRQDASVFINMLTDLNKLVGF